MQGRLFWETHYTWDSVFRKTIYDKLKDYGDTTVNWYRYMYDRELWVTETNCYWETVNDNPDATYSEKNLPHLTSEEQYLRITGQKEDTHGAGSIVAMNNIGKIERYSLWKMWTKTNYLTYKDGQLTPLGRGYLYPTNTGTDCSYRGQRVKVDDDDDDALIELDGATK
jgi:hypothetical protein